ncbi:MAG: hypothetical protein KDD45_06215, partial [Bdellovibrionales bacterium]|nr:hypothetical protein [Bdellovibrionales bacterium]
KILGFGKIKPEDSVKGYHYTGICILNEKIFNYLPEGESNILHDGVLSAIKDQQRVEVFNIDCHWFETGNEDDFKAASKKSLELLKTNSYSGIYLNALIAKFAPNSRMVLKEHQWILYDQSSKFNPDHVQGFLVIGSNSKLPSDIIVKNSVIGENVEVRTHQNINNKLLMYGN